MPIESDPCIIGPQQVGSVDAVKYNIFPISVLSSNTDSVSFTVSQKWTNDCSIDRISTKYQINQLVDRCDSETNVIPDELFTYTAFCVDNIAAVSVFVHEHASNGTVGTTFPSLCTQDGAIAHGGRYDFLIPCGCDTATSQPLSVFDTCSPKVVSFEETHLGIGALVSQQFTDDGINVSGQVFSADSEGTLLDGVVRLFDTSGPTDTTGYGNLEFSGPYGSVLVLQQSGVSDQWNVHTQGGSMIFDFLFPMHVFELSLLNVGNDINVLATGAAGSNHSFSIPGTRTREMKDLVMDISDVKRIVVSSHGPFAVAHLGVCNGSSVHPSPSLTDRCDAGIQRDDARDISLLKGLPITVDESDSDTVSFTVTQTWAEHCSIKWLGTQYQSTSSDIRCDVEYKVVPNQTFQYTAACVDGFAKIAVYVHDSDINATDTSVVPDLCAVGSADLRSSTETFIIPCGCPQHTSGGSVASVSTCDLYDLSFDDKGIAPGSYVSLQWSDHNVKFSGKERENGSGGFFPEGHLRLFDTAAPLDSDGYGTADLQSADGNVLVIQEADRSQWKANQAGGVITMTFSSPAEVAEIGLLNVVNDVKVRVTTIDESSSRFLLTAGGPRSIKSVVIDRSNIVEVELTLFGPTAISHVTLCEPRVDVRAPSPAQTIVPSSIASQNHVSCNRDVFEDYETEGQSDSWDNGSEYDDSHLTTFLGRLGGDHPRVSKVFAVAVDADSIDVTFDIYDLDGMPGDGRVFVGIQGSYVDLGLMSLDGTKKYYNDIEIIGSVKITPHITSKYDMAYAVSIRVPKDYYKDYNFELPISFKIETTKTISSKSYGIDNLRLHANCMRRELQDPTLAAKSDKSADDHDNDENPFYCSSKDYPCEGGNGMVYVCHYSARKGYETFCVPEPDSEILRFYSNDYCGPCIGGFGIHQQMIDK
jgi:hypothetical protein